MDFSSFFGQGNSSTASTGGGTAGGAGYSNASRSAAAQQITPTIQIGGIGSGAQSLSSSPSLTASPELASGGVLGGSGGTLQYVLLAAIVVALLVRK